MRYNLSGVNASSAPTESTNVPTRSSYYSFITADGTAFSLSSSQNNCILSPAYISANGFQGHLTQLCGAVFIDVNGPQKGPATYGRDIFYFYITNGKGATLYPVGGGEDGAYWSTGGKCASETYYGTACAARIIQEGWQMNY